MHDHWEEDVGSVALESDDGLILIDPLDPPRGLRRPEHVLVYWLPAQRAVVPGDVLLGAGAKPRATNDRLRLCPERWLGKATHDDLRRSLRPLLDLPVQRVVVSHGKPVLRNGKRALEQLLH